MLTAEAPSYPTRMMVPRRLSVPRRWVYVPKEYIAHFYDIHIPPGSVVNEYSVR